MTIIFSFILTLFSFSTYSSETLFHYNAGKNICVDPEGNPGLNMDGLYGECENLFQRNLSGLDLHGKNLKGSVLDYSNLKGTNLEGANLSGASLRGVVIDSMTKFKGAIYSTNTFLPFSEQQALDRGMVRSLPQTNIDLKLESLFISFSEDRGSVEALMKEATELIELGADVNFKRYPNSDTVLFHAIDKRPENVAIILTKFLVKNGADPNLKGGFQGKRSPLTKAIDNDYVGVAKILLSSGAFANTPEVADVLRYNLKSLKPSYDLVKVFLDYGLNPNSTGSESNDPCLAPIYNININHPRPGDLIDLLLERGAKVDSCPYLYVDLLTRDFSAFDQRLKIFDALKKYRIPFPDYMNVPNTPIINRSLGGLIAESAADAKVLKRKHELLQKAEEVGVNFRFADKIPVPNPPKQYGSYGRTPLMIYLISSRYARIYHFNGQPMQEYDAETDQKIISFLKARGLHPDDRDNHGLNVIHQLAGYDFDKEDTEDMILLMFKRLVDAGADIHGKDDEGLGVLQHARKPNIKNVLIKLGAQE